LLDCLGYLEDVDDNQNKVRHALVYQLPFLGALGNEAYGGFEKFKTLLDLLNDRKKMWPPLDTRFQLARSLCRSMLLYHASDWIHHDFRSDNVIFMVYPSLARTDENGTSSGDEYGGCRIDEPYVTGYGFARHEEDPSWTFEERKKVDESIRKQRLYWSPAYIASSNQRPTRAFQRSHDIYSLGCVLLELGVWQPLEGYSWKSEYATDHRKWHKRLLQEEDKLKAMCGTRYAEVVMNCLTWGTSDTITDVQMLCFDILQKLEELVV
jgi:serine/threonine protein kinase